MSATAPTLSTALTSDSTVPPGCATSRFYRQVLQWLLDGGVPFLVGGAFALRHFTGIERDTKDLDLFIRREDYPRTHALLKGAGLRTELTYPHWLAKVMQGDAFIDLIFNSGNGLTPVDDEWFQHAQRSDVLGMSVMVHPAEEMMWSKAFVMERERYDGADVAHILKSCAKVLDWPRVMRRFAPHWRVLLSHLVLFGFIYPDRRDDIPAWVMTHLLDRACVEMHASEQEGPAVCCGTLLSREQYLVDVTHAGYEDARLLSPLSDMNESDIAHWTRAIHDRD